MHSIGKPGVNPGLMKFVSGVFVVLALFLAIMLFALESFNIHVFMMLILSIGLLASISW